ncbi:hypothetical protein AYO41_04820 [Verrucomicrobia bacterium SCGC AG-212-E04]|nr:hypothetical protein AYO41_04820 [Verrucomicrobia bacterium SCGC AG-212-E04]
MLSRSALFATALACAAAALLAPTRGAGSDISEVGDVMANEGFAFMPLRRGSDDQFELAGRVTVNGISGRFLVDTGARVSVIDRRSLKRFKLTSERTTARISGALGGRTESLRAALATSFRVGPADMRPFIFGVANLGALNDSRDRSDDDFHGIIGTDVLRTYQFIIDYRGLRLFVRIDDPKNASRTNLGTVLKRNGYAEIPLSRIGTTEFEFTARVNGTDVAMLVDTGAAVTLLDRTQARYAGLRLQRTDEVVRGAAGTSRGLMVARVESFRAGSFATGPLQMAVTDLNPLNLQFAQAGRPLLGGYLGSDFLRAKGAIIDCANLRLYLKE